MRCEDVKSRLSEYQLGGLHVIGRRQIEHHLAECEACRTELDSLKALDTVLTESHQPEAPPDLWGRIEDRLEYVPAPKREINWKWAWAPAGVLAVALVAFVWHGRTVPATLASGEQPEVGYEQRHALLGWDDPTADRVQIGVTGWETRRASH